MILRLLGGNFGHLFKDDFLLLLQIYAFFGGKLSLAENFCSVRSEKKEV